MLNITISLNCLSGNGVMMSRITGVNASSLRYVIAPALMIFLTHLHHQLLLDVSRVAWIATDESNAINRRHKLTKPRKI
jgi:hypothetical protein